MKHKNKLVLSFSGGSDSTVLLYMAAASGYDEIHTLTFNYGQRHVREIECVEKQLKHIRDRWPTSIITNKIIDVSYIKDIAPVSSLTNDDIETPHISKMAGDAQPASYVPFRNQMFLSICCSYAESLQVTNVWYGAAQVDSLAGYWDGSEQFVDNFNNLISHNRMNIIKVSAPLLTYSKADIVREGVRLGVNFKDTWTCYSRREDNLADVTTPSSSLRVKGFIEAGYRDPIQYVQQEQLESLYRDNNCAYI